MTKYIDKEMSVKKYHSVLYEAIDSVESYVKKVESIIRKHFPKSSVNVNFSDSFGEGITIKFALGNGEKEFSNGIWQNDPMFSVYFINGIEDGVLGERLSVDSSTAGSIGTEDYKRIKVGWRKKTANPEGILKHLDNYFKKMKDLGVANKDRIDDIGGHL